MLSKHPVPNCWMFLALLVVVLNDTMISTCPEVTSVKGPMLACRMMADHPLSSPLAMLDAARTGRPFSPIVGDEAIVLATSGNSISAIKLRAGSVRVRLAPSAAIPGGAQTLAARIDVLAPDRRLYLMLEGVCAMAQPGVLFHLYLDLPPGRAPARSDPRSVGDLNFFDAVRPCDSSPSPLPPYPFYSYDVTALLKRLRTARLLARNTTVTIRSSGTPAVDAMARIARIRLVEQAFKPGPQLAPTPPG